MTAENGVREAAGKAFKTRFDAVIALEADGAAPFWIDGWFDPPKIMAKTPDKPVDCRWRARAETFLRALESEHAFESAFVSGRLSIAGDISVMKRLKLESAR
ncbi:MAG: SCP2 sterol-binding domain-containing protein [Parvularculaceae bacterium]